MAKVMNSNKEGKHFVLVHGAGHGAWCWYKVKPLLQKAGHRVTALDMAASGVHPAKIHELNTLRDYTEPLIKLMESIPDDEKVILVGHSLGGMNLAVVMELFPHKIEAAVFLTALMPDTQNKPTFVVEQFVGTIPEGGWLDTEFTCSGDPAESFNAFLFGPNIISVMYSLSPVEDIELVMALKRRASFFLHDASIAKKFSEEKWGTIRQVYVICKEDRLVSQEFQQWMAENGGVKEVKELQGSDHMPMFSVPQKLCDCLVEIGQSE